MQGFFVPRVLFACCLALLGFAFLRYRPFKRFGFLSTMFTLCSIYGGFIMALHFKTAFSSDIVLLVMALVLFVLTVWKLFCFKDLNFMERLPLNFCNILIIFICIRPVYQSAVLDNYIVCIGFIAGIVNYFIGAYYDGASGVDSQGKGVFYYHNLEALILHNLFFTYCFYTIASGLIPVDLSEALWNAIWIVPLFIFFSFANQVWKTDFFFTGTYGATPPFLVTLQDMLPFRFKLTMRGRVFDVKLLYSLILIIAFLLAFPAAALFLGWTQGLCLS
jgi:hypothetical protein